MSECNLRELPLRISASELVVGTVSGGGGGGRVVALATAQVMTWVWVMFGSLRELNLNGARRLVKDDKQGSTMLSDEKRNTA